MDAFYTCPYCNEEYTSPSDLAHCILSCEDKKKREEEERRKAEFALQKADREKEVRDAYDNFKILLKAFIKDYGSFSTMTSTDACFNTLLNDWFWRF